MSSSGDLYSVLGAVPRTISSTVDSGPNLSLTGSCPGQILGFTSSHSFNKHSVPSWYNNYLYIVKTALYAGRGIESFLQTLSLQPDGVNLWHFKIRLFDLTE